MGTTMFNNGDVSISISAPKEDGNVGVWFIINTKEAWLDAGFVVQRGEDEDFQGLRSRAMWDCAALYKRLLALGEGVSCDKMRELPEPLRERYMGLDHFVYRDDSVEFTVTVALLPSKSADKERGSEYETDCKWAVKTFVWAYESVTGQMLDLTAVGVDN